MSGDMYQRLYEQFFKGSAEERMPLTPAELELAGFIHPIVTAFLKNILSNSGSDTDACETQDFQDKLRLARTNLKVIIEMFSESDAARKEFVCEYPSYARKRGESISHLRNLATSINTDKHNCNISQVTGSSVGILGGMANVLSLACTPAGKALAISGIIATGLGSAVTIGTTMTETELIKKKVNEATTILKQDEKDFQVFAKWFAHSIAFEEAANALLLGIDVLRIIGLRIHGLDKSDSQFKTGLHIRIDASLEESFKNKKIDPKTAPILSVSLTTVYVVFLRRSSLRMDAVEKTAQQMGRFAVVMKVSISVLKASLKRIMTQGSQTAVRVAPRFMHAAKVIFMGIGTTFEVLNIVESAMDLSSGSRSSYAEEITKAADTLQKELDVLRDVYYDIK